MSEEFENDGPYQDAQSAEELECYVMGSTFPKTPAEWWARGEIERLRARIAEQNYLLKMKWRAEDRAIKAWQEKTGERMTWPDQAKLVEWLMDELHAARARIVELERDFHKQCELTARTMTRVADAEGEAAMLSMLLERREEALMQVDKMCDAFPGLLAIQNIVRAALNGEKK